MGKKLYIGILVMVVFSLLFAVSGCSRHKVVKRYSSEQAEQHLRGRIWVDRYPENNKQPFLAYFFDSRKDLGVHIRAHSMYKRTYEYYGFRVDSEKVSFLFPHDDRKAESRYSVEEIRPVGRFNLKLTFYNDPQEKGRKSKYFSNTQWRSSESFTNPQELMDLLSTSAH